jgi:hypothetical protein
VKGFVAEASQIDRAKTGSAVADDLSLDDEAYTKTQTTPLAEDVNAVDVADRNPRHFVRSAAESVSVSDSATRLLAAQRSSTDSN